MNMIFIILWTILLLFFIVIEAVSVQLVSIWLALGAVIALGAATLNISFKMQIILFVLISAISLVLTRPLIKKWKIKKEPTNSDRCIGEKVRVINEINNVEGTGSVLIRGTEWSARAEKETIIKKDSMVRIIRIEGVKVIVEEE